MNKKIFLVITALILLIIIAIVVFSIINKKSQEANSIYYNAEPEFLSEERKAYFGLAPKTKAQILGYDNGYEIYKIIKDDSEIE